MSDLATVIMQMAEREKLHDERHAVLQTSVQELKTMVSWIGSVMITLIIGVLGWSLVQQWNANEAQKRALQDQIIELQRGSPVMNQGMNELK